MEGHLVSFSVVVEILDIKSYQPTVVVRLMDGRAIRLFEGLTNVSSALQSVINEFTQVNDKK